VVAKRPTGQRVLPEGPWRGALQGRSTHFFTHNTPAKGVVGARAIERPDFNATSGEWVRLSALQSAVGIAGSQHFNKLRKRVGAAFEHREIKDPYRGLWFWLPGWIPAWRAAVDSAPSAAGTGPSVKEQRDLLALEHEKLDFEERKIKHAKLMQEVMSFAEANEVLASVLGGVGRVADKLPPEFKRMLVDEIKEGREAYRDRFNGHSDPRITDEGGIGVLRPGGVSGNANASKDASRVRKSVRDHAARRAVRKPKVP
jgi:hypothetical protein